MHACMHTCVLPHLKLEWTFLSLYKEGRKSLFSRWGQTNTTDRAGILASLHQWQGCHDKLGALSSGLGAVPCASAEGLSSAECGYSLQTEPSPICFALTPGRAATWLFEFLWAAIIWKAWLPLCCHRHKSTLCQRWEGVKLSCLVRKETCRVQHSKNSILWECSCLQYVGGCEVYLWKLQIFKTKRKQLPTT